MLLSLGLIALAGALFIEWRWCRLAVIGIEGAPAWKPSQATRALWAALLVLAGMVPLALAVPSFFAAAARLPPDAVSHAVVAERIARVGMPHGWIDAYNGGFPFGPHYQSVPILLVAGLIKLGVEPARATQALGLIAVFATPMLVAAGTALAGADVLAAVLGGLALAWIAPFPAFVGGWDAYLGPGLLSQVVALPVVVACAMAIVLDRPRRAAPWLAALLLACHTQIGVCAFVVGVPVALVAFDHRARERFFRAGIGAVASALALYGAGARSFAVPFSWPHVTPTKILGFPPARLWLWLDGLLLDLERAPVFTTMCVASLFVLLAFVRSRAARGALVLVSVTTALSVAGTTLVTLGESGRRMVEFVSPVRMMVLIPLGAALAIIIAVHELTWRARAIVGTAYGRTIAPAFGGALLLLLAAVALPERMRWLAIRRTLDDRMSPAAIDDCGRNLPRGFRAEDGRRWVERLAPTGRFAVDRATASPLCAAMLGLEVASRAPMGLVVGGPGSQVGVLQQAFENLDATRPRGELRADSLGVQYVLAGLAEGTDPPIGFRVLERRGDAALLERVGSTGLVGVGCVVEVWRGRDRALRDALFEALGRKQSPLDRPRELVALEPADESVTRREVDLGGCVVDALERATLRVSPREPGAYEARVVAPVPLDLVIRATAFPTWTVRVDGAITPSRTVVPGFLAVRVAEGAHHVEAEAAPPPHYRLGILAAFLVTLAAALVEPRRLLRRITGGRYRTSG